MNRIYLAYPSLDDPESLASRDRLVSQLGQYEGMEILPRESAAEITDAQISAALESADLSVHFLGIFPGKCDVRGRGIVQRQFELAEEIERRKDVADLRSRDPKIVYLKSRRLCEIEDLRFDPEEWDSNDGPDQRVQLGRDLRSHLHFLCRVVKQRVPVKVFYSYARSDREHLERLRRSLIMARRSGKVIEWYDGLLNPGEDWNEETSAALDDCDVLVYLVTPDAVASSYAYHKEYGRAMKLGKKVIAVSVSSAVISGTGIGDNQMMPLDGNQRLCPVDEWDSVNKAWTSVSEQLQEVLETWSREKRLGAESVAIEPCSDLGELKELLEARFRLRASGPNLYGDLGPMIFLDWVKRPESDRQLDRLKAHLAGCSRLTCASTDLSRPRNQSYTETMYGCSDAVLVYCSDRRTETAATLQQWVWQFERRRRSTEDRPKCIAVLDFARCQDGLSSSEFAESFPNGGTIVVIVNDDAEPESLLEPLWRKIGA